MSRSKREVKITAYWKGFTNENDASDVVLNRKQFYEGVRKWTVTKYTAQFDQNLTT